MNLTYSKKIMYNTLERMKKNGRPMVGVSACNNRRMEA
jgi:hypothetical protein